MPRYPLTIEDDGMTVTAELDHAQVRALIVSLVNWTNDNPVAAGRCPHPAHAVIAVGPSRILKCRACSEVLE